MLMVSFFHNIIIYPVWCIRISRNCNRRPPDITRCHVKEGNSERIAKMAKTVIKVIKHVINIQATFFYFLALLLSTLSLLITCRSQIYIMRSPGGRCADISWNMGKIPIWFFVIQILVSRSVVFNTLSYKVSCAKSLLRSDWTQTIPMFHMDLGIHSWKRFSTGYRVIWMIVYCLIIS